MHISWEVRIELGWEGKEGGRGSVLARLAVQPVNGKHVCEDIFPHSASSPSFISVHRRRHKQKKNEKKTGYIKSGRKIPHSNFPLLLSFTSSVMDKENILTAHNLLMLITLSQYSRFHVSMAFVA